jgi:hypothetical protein
MAYPPEEALEADEPVLFAFEGDGAWGLLEFTYGYGLSDQVLATVSEGARVWMASWHFKGGHTVVYAADGRIRARMWEFVFGDRREEDGDPSALAGLRTMLDGLARDDFDGKCAAVFAFTEQTTGVGFDADQLLAENAPVIVLDVPRPRLPPLPGHHEGCGTANRGTSTLNHPGAIRHESDIIPA